MKRWPTKPLREVLELSRERIEPVEHPDTSFNYVGLEVIEGHTGKLLPCQPTAGVEIKSTKNVFHRGEILYGKLRPYLNKVHLAGDDGICSTDIYVLRPRQGRIHPSFAANYLRSASVLSMVSNAMAGANLPRISQDALLEIPIPVPPLVEQERIVKLLDEADKLQKLRAQADRRTADLIPALFHEMFANEITENSRPLGEVCEKVTDGVHITPTYVDEGVPFLRVTDIKREEVDWVSVKRIPPNEYEQITRRVKPEQGDILYSKNGTIGIAKEITWERPFAHFVSLALLKPNRNFLNPTFLAAWLNTPDALRQAVGHSKTGTVTNLHLNEIKKFRVPCPKLERQTYFVQRAADIRALKAKQSACCGRLDDLFQSLLHRAFEGEL